MSKAVLSQPLPREIPLRKVVVEVLELDVRLVNKVVVNIFPILSAAWSNFNHNVVKKIN